MQANLLANCSTLFENGLFGVSLISSAENKSAELRKLAKDYVDDLMRQTEESLTGSLNTIRDARSTFRGGKPARRMPAANPEEL